VDVTRREALRRLSFLVGGAISAPVMSAVLSGCRARSDSAGWTPQALTPEQVELVDTLVDLIIPPTDTPGAREAGVTAFIDKLLHDWVVSEDRTRFLTGLADLDDQARRAHDAAFTETPLDQQRAMLARLDQEASRARADRTDPLPFFATLKEWTLVGYYTSEAGATEELQWLAAPGRYDADLPLTQVGRTWA